MASSAWKIIPFFPSNSIPRTIEFYTSHLGFKLGGVDGSRIVDPQSSLDTKEPTMCSIFVGKKAAANIYFFTHDHGDQKGDDYRPKPLASPAEVMIALGTKELDEYYEFLKSDEKVKIMSVPEDKPWGYRQFTVEDPDQNRLTFFKFLEGGNPGDE